MKTQGPTPPPAPAALETAPSSRAAAAGPTAADPSPALAPPSTLTDPAALPRSRSATAPSRSPLPVGSLDGAPSPAHAPCIGILSAVIEEQQALQAAMERPRIEHHAGREFVCGRLHGREVVLVLSRIGKVAAAITATLLIERFGAQALVFTGVAGALGDGVQVGDVIVARELLQHDLDASPLFPRYEVPMLGRSHFPTDAVLSDALRDAAHEALEAERIGLAASFAALGIEQPTVHEGLVVSGDRFVATAAESALLHAELPEALAVEMEGAAVAQVCHDADVPFAVLRTVSDRADDEAHVDFKRFLDEVAGPLAGAVVRCWLGRLPPDVLALTA